MVVVTYNNIYNVASENKQKCITPACILLLHVHLTSHKTYQKKISWVVSGEKQQTSQMRRILV